MWAMWGVAWHALALAALGVGALAVQVQHSDAERDSPAGALYGDTHHLTWSPTAANAPGSYELLRVPRSLSQPQLLSVRGFFDDVHQPDETECHGLYMKNLTLKGNWLAGKFVHFQWKDGLQMKVSSMEPRFAGPWRSIESYESWHSASEDLPSALQLREHEDGSFLVRLGPEAAEDAGLSLYVTAENPGLAAVFFNASKLALGGNSTSVRRRTEECQQAVGPQYSIFNYFHNWNLGAAIVALDEQGTHEMLRLPKFAEEPALLRVKGTVEASVDAPCGLSLTGLTFDGAWLGHGGATLQLSLAPDFLYRVTNATSEGPWEDVEDLRLDSPYSTFKGLPDTVKILADKDKSGATTGFRLYVGPSASLEERPMFEVSKGDSGLSMYYIRRFTTEPNQRGAGCGNLAALSAFRTKLYRMPGLHLSRAGGLPYAWMGGISA